jgi:hypothetical protein
MFEDYRVKNFPIPGIEPRPANRKLSILSARPYGTLEKYDLKTICILLFHHTNYNKAKTKSSTCNLTFETSAKSSSDLKNILLV